MSCIHFEYWPADDADYDDCGILIDEDTDIDEIVCPVREIAYTADGDEIVAEVCNYDGDRLTIRANGVATLDDGCQRRSRERLTLRGVLSWLRANPDGYCNATEMDAFELRKAIESRLCRASIANS